MRSGQRGIDFDDLEYGFKEEDKHPVKVSLILIDPLESTGALTEYQSLGRE